MNPHHGFPSRFASLLVLGSLALAGCTLAGTNTVVTVRAQADPSYVASRAAAVPGTTPVAATVNAADQATAAQAGAAALTGASPEASASTETYVFARGRFFPSMFDPQIKAVEFGALTQTLASGLNGRFAPAPNPNRADLVIVVHWGAIERPEDSMDMLIYDPDTLRQANEAIGTARTQAAADFRAGNYLSYGQVAAAEANFRNELNVAESVFAGDAQVAANKAELIGIRGLYRHDDPSADAAELRSLIEEDRYFVTLFAFDAQLLKLKQKRIVWTARMSAPVAGRDFATAVREMTRAAAPYFGTQQPRMILSRPEVAAK